MPLSGDGNDEQMGHMAQAIPHPQKVLFPGLGITRGQVALYYASVSRLLVDHARNRALTVKRWPEGITGPMFYQKHPSPGDQWIHIRDWQDVVHWVGLGVIEWHAPLGTIEAPLVHDWAVMDLDPNPPAGWVQVAQVTKIFTELLSLLKIPFLLKTSGQKGLHVYIPIEPLPHSEVVRHMESLAKTVTAAFPDLCTVARLKKSRGNRVYLDYLQNGHKRTMAMVYSLRAVPEASVSTPIRPEEVSVDPTYWTMDRVLTRIRDFGDLFRWPGPRVVLADRLRRLSTV